MKSIFKQDISNVDYKYCDVDILNDTLFGGNTYQLDYFKLDVFFLGKLVF